MEELELELDISKIVELEKYNDFYKEKVTSVDVNYIYLDKYGNIEKISTNPIILSRESVMTKEQLVFLIKKEILNNRNYSLNNIFKFNISLNNDDVISLYNDKFNEFNEFIETFNGFNDIYWKDTINLFKDMNELNIIFMKKKTTGNSTTKRIYFKKNTKKTRRNYN